MKYKRSLYVRFNCDRGLLYFHALIEAIGSHMTYTKIISQAISLLQYSTEISFHLLAQEETERAPADTTSRNVGDSRTARKIHGRLRRASHWVTSHSRWLDTEMMVW